ncbi:MAG: hypothetical protein HQ567_02020 [Candidatus Nealsonbacteria bacterium]|nr:hypothetical protein [Candidatus Nealsonbacteria bacterium]
MRLKTYAGYIESESEAYGGRTPGTLTLVDTGQQMVAHLVFFDERGEPVLITVEGPGDPARNGFVGTSRDPRGWDVTWSVTVLEDSVIGTYVQPHDQGSIAMKRLLSSPNNSMEATR